MASVTYYAVLPFVRDEDGNLCPDEAVECQSSAGAVARARALGAVKAGVVAFSRTGDPETGEWADAVVLTQILATVSRFSPTPAPPRGGCAPPRTRTASARRTRRVLAPAGNDGVDAPRRHRRAKVWC